jgi:hypothetical protein
MSDHGYVPKYVKKPIPVEAMHLNSDNAGRVAAWIKAGGGAAIIRGGPKGGSDGASIGILTLEGRIWYEPGWVVIRGVQGEFYACRRDVFEESYELAEDER